MTLTHRALAAALLAGGVSLSTAALACPNAKKASPPPVAANHTECGYKSGYNKSTACCASMASQVVAAGVPSGLIAFGLGWLTGGRKKRDDKKQALAT